MVAGVAWRFRSWLPWVGLAVFAVPLVMVALMASVIGGLAGSGGQFDPSADALADIPFRFLALYQSTGQKYGLDWTYLAAIGKMECNHGRDCGVSSAGALGPMQFMPATWRGYATDGNGDRRADAMDPADAIAGAAKYLKASGAPKDWRRALFAYNHAGWYVEKVIRQAAEYRGAAMESSGGAIAGSPKHIIDSIVIPMAQQVGIRVTVASVTAANARHGPTVSGTTSDHQGPPNVAWAADMGNGSRPTPEMDRLAERLARRFNVPWAGSGLVNTTGGRYRYQLIYRTMKGGNHFNHVHFGVRRT